MADYVKPVVFKVSDFYYGVDINLVQAIEEKASVVPVPNSVEFITGIINLRGEIIPVLSLNKKFGVENPKPASNMIIVNVKDTNVALEVDSVVEIRDLTATDIVKMPILVTNKDNSFMDRVARIKDQLVVLLDTYKLFSEDELSGLKKMKEDLNKD